MCGPVTSPPPQGPTSSSSPSCPNGIVVLGFCLLQRHPARRLYLRRGRPSRRLRPLPRRRDGDLHQPVPADGADVLHLRGPAVHRLPLCSLSRRRGRRPRLPVPADGGPESHHRLPAGHPPVTTGDLRGRLRIVSAGTGPRDVRWDCLAGQCVNAPQAGGTAPSLSPHRPRRAHGCTVGIALSARVSASPVPMVPAASVGATLVLPTATTTTAITCPPAGGGTSGGGGSQQGTPCSVGVAPAGKSCITCKDGKTVGVLNLCGGGNAPAPPGGSVPSSFLKCDDGSSEQFLDDCPESCWDRTFAKKPNVCPPPNPTDPNFSAYLAGVKNNDLNDPATCLALVRTSWPNMPPQDQFLTCAFINPGGGP
jgi:hypothetical protein